MSEMSGMRSNGVPRLTADASYNILFRLSLISLHPRESGCLGRASSIDDTVLYHSARIAYEEQISRAHHDRIQRSA